MIIEADVSDPVRTLAKDYFGQATRFDPETGVKVSSGEKALWIHPDGVPSMLAIKKFSAQANKLSTISYDGDEKCLKAVFK